MTATTDASDKTGRNSKLPKPTKPYPDFPLYAHASRRWAKKIRGKLFYFGSWADGWQAALESYVSQRDDLHAGRKRKRDPLLVTLGEVMGKYLLDCEARMNKTKGREDDRLSEAHFALIAKTIERVTMTLGKRTAVATLEPADFGRLMASYAERNWSAPTLDGEIRRVRAAFSWAVPEEIPEVPHYGRSFSRPSAQAKNAARIAKGEKWLTAEQLRAVLAVTAKNPQLHAAVLLGVNLGFGLTDCCNLTMSVIDLDSGWFNYPRQKTTIQRRCPLWPETIEALRAAIKARPKPRDPAHHDRVFLTPRGGLVNRMGHRPLSVAFRKALVKAGVKARDCTIDEATGKKSVKTRDPVDQHACFASLRHVFYTVAENETRDRPAVKSIMGHAQDTREAASHYRTSISDERRRAVVDAVRAWLFGDGAKQAGANDAGVSHDAK